MDRIKCATFNKEMQDSIPPEIREKMKADREKAEKEQRTKAENLPIQNVMCCYFRCRFFKNQTLTSEIYKAENEDDCRKQFKKRHRTLNLLECVPL
jgi:hypothetical protein